MAILLTFMLQIVGGTTQGSTAAPANPAAASSQQPAAPVSPSATGVPPTPTPAFPGLPVPRASSGLPAGTPPDPLTQDLRGPVSLTPSQVADLQTRLAANGFYRGPIDGALNGPTRSSIRAYQEATRLPVTGQPDAPTVNSIGVSAPGRAAETFGTPFPLSSTSDSTIFIQP